MLWRPEVFSPSKVTCQCKTRITERKPVTILSDSLPSGQDLKQWHCTTVLLLFQALLACEGARLLCRGKAAHSAGLRRCPQRQGASDWHLCP